MKTLVTNFDYEKWVEVQSLVKAVNEHNAKYSRANASDAENLLASLICCIENVPFAEVAPVIHAQWLPESDDDQDEGCYYCSNCKSAEFFPEGIPFSRYCSECGAKMDLNSK